MRRAFKYRLFVSDRQAFNLEMMLESHRKLYNASLAERKERYERSGESFGYREQRAQFKFERLENPFYAELSVDSAHETMKRLDLAYKAFFRRVKSGERPGFPRFKGREFFTSINYPHYGSGIKLTGNRLYVRHIGTLRVQLHRPVEGLIKTACLKREAGKWYVVFSCDLGDAGTKPSTKPAVGIDLGLSRFFTTSNDDKSEWESNPRYLKAELAELRRLQRHICRMKRGGSNRRKAVVQLTKLHAKVKNARKWHRNDVARRLLEKYGTICIEKLNIRQMFEDSEYSRSIADVGWGGFIQTLKSQAEKVGAAIIEVEPRGTSQGCSGCEAIVPKTLRDRRHVCPSCGLDIDRDLNAARNILRRGLGGAPPVDPVKSGNGANGRRRPRRSPSSKEPSENRIGMRSQRES